jgi:hypothetical protein
MSLGYLDVTKFESENINLELIEKWGEGESEISVFVNKDDGHYYCKGPFARYESICYIDLHSISSPEALQDWIQQMKSLNK